MKANVAYKPEDMDGSDKALTHLSLEIAGKPDAVTACGIRVAANWQVDYNDIEVTCPKCLKWSGFDFKEEKELPAKGTKAYLTSLIQRLIEGTELYIEILEEEVTEGTESTDWDALDEIEYYKEAVDEINNQLSIEAKKETT